MRRLSLPLLLLCFLSNAAVTRAQVNRRAAIDHLNRGTKELAAGDLDDALAEFNRAIELDPNYSASYFNRGLVRKRQANYDGAISDFTKAIELNPIAEAYLDRGAARKDNGDREGAISDYTKAIELNPKNAKSHANRGMIMLLQGRDAAAQKELDTALTMGGSLNPDLQNRIDQIVKGRKSKP
jgi:tetratricopeptide (TPR) repeat protein